MNASLDISETAILARAFRPDASDWPAAAAEAILRVGFDERDHVRMSELLEKAQAGELAADETLALENYVVVGRILEMMKSRARRSLNAQQPQ